MNISQNGEDRLSNIEEYVGNMYQNIFYKEDSYYEGARNYLRAILLKIKGDMAR